MKFQDWIIYKSKALYCRLFGHDYWRSQPPLTTINPSLRCRRCGKRWIL